MDSTGDSIEDRMKRVYDGKGLRVRQVDRRITNEEYRQKLTAMDR